MALADTQTNPATLDTGEDQLSHRFCKDQAKAWLGGNPATARCGKTKTDWEPADGEDLLCVICYELYKTSSCIHCTNKTEGTGK